MFFLLIVFHQVSTAAVFFMTTFWIISSIKMFDALNNALGILMLNSLHFIGSKYLLKRMRSQNIDINNNQKYLQFQIKTCLVDGHNKYVNIINYTIILLQIVMMAFNRTFLYFVTSLPESTYLILIYSIFLIVII